MGLLGMLRGVLAYAFGQRIETRCPFCGRRVTIDTAACAVLHDVPACRAYVESEDSLDFVTKIRVENDRQRKEKSS